MGSTTPSLSLGGNADAITTRVRCISSSALLPSTWIAGCIVIEGCPAPTGHSLNSLPFGFIAPVPLIVTGTIGTPCSTANRNAPSLNLPKGGPRVPSAKNTILPPSTSFSLHIPVSNAAQNHFPTTRLALSKGLDLRIQA